MKIILSPDAAEAVAASGTGEELFEGGQGEGQGATGAAGGEGAAAEGAAGEGAGTGTAGAGAAAATGLSKDDVQQILTGALQQVGQRAQPQQQQERTYSQEEFDKAFNVLKFSPELLAQLRHEDPATAMKALETIRDGMVRQAMTMAEYRVQALIKEIRDNELAPIQSFVSEQQATSFRNDFFKSNPDLEKYETIVDAVAAKLAQQGVKGTRAEMMSHYATESKKIVAELTAASGQQANGNAVNGKAGGGQASTTRRMSTLTGGGQTEKVGGGAKAAKGPPGIEVFDD